MTTLFGIDEQTLEILISLVSGFIASHGYLKIWDKSKAKTIEHNVRLFVDSVDNALYNDKIDETTFRTIYETGKNLFSFQRTIQSPRQVKQVSS